MAKKSIVSPVGAGLVLDSIGGSNGNGFALGDVGFTKDGDKVLFVQATGAISSGNVLGITPSYVAGALTSAMYNANYKLGFAQDAVSSGQYFWALVDPIANVDISVAASCGGGVRLFVTTTAGVLDDATVAEEIFGLQLLAGASAPASTGPHLMNAVASYPRAST